MRVQDMGADSALHVGKVLLEKCCFLKFDHRNQMELDCRAVVLCLSRRLLELYHSSNACFGLCT